MSVGNDHSHLKKLIYSAKQIYHRNGKKQTNKIPKNNKKQPANQPNPPPQKKKPTQPNNKKTHKKNYPNQNENPSSTTKKTLTSIL